MCKISSDGLTRYIWWLVPNLPNGEQDYNHSVVAHSKITFNPQTATIRSYYSACGLKSLIRLDNVNLRFQRVTFRAPFWNFRCLFAGTFQSLFPVCSIKWAFPLLSLSLARSLCCPLPLQTGCLCLGGAAHQYKADEIARLRPLWQINRDLSKGGGLSFGSRY